MCLAFPENTIIGMPVLSLSITQSNSGTWQKAVDDQLSLGKLFVEIKTDKAQMDFEFQEKGYPAKVVSLETGIKGVSGLYPNRCLCGKSRR